MSAPDAERVASLLSAHAQACLLALQRDGAAPRPAASVKAAGGWVVLALAAPSSPGDAAPQLSDCDVDCLALLAQCQEPMSAARLRRELERRGLAVWSVVTVKRSLARLRRLGVVGNSRRRPRGYWLAADLPLFRRVS
jgi:hypothetical protein